MSFESISGDAENNRASSGVSRRSVLKVGAHAAWAVPLVQVVAAAPAVAVSGAPKLSFTTFSANYGTSAGPSAADPTHLFVTAVIKNDGGQTQGLQVTLTVPANRYDKAPVVNAGNGWSASAPTGSLAAGWTIVLTVASQLGNSASTPTLTATLTLDDSVATRKFDGTSFALSGLGTSTVAGTTNAVSSATVPATPSATLAIDTFGVAYQTSGNVKSLRVSAAKVVATGASSCGPISLEVTIPKGKGYLDRQPGTPTGLSTGWGFDSVSGSGPWVFKFTASGTLAPNGQTGSFQADLPMNGNGNESTALTFTAVAKGSHATDSAPASKSV